MTAVAAHGHGLLAPICVVEQWVTPLLSQPASHEGLGPSDRNGGGKARGPSPQARRQVHHVIRRVVGVQVAGVGARPVPRNGQQVLWGAHRLASGRPHHLDSLEGDTASRVGKTREFQIQRGRARRVRVLAAGKV